MSTRKKLRVVLTNLFLFSLLFGLVSLNKEILRPVFGGIRIVRPVLDCFPNFIAAYIICLFFVNGALTMKPKRSRLLVWLSSCAVFGALTIEELRPMWGASTQYDILDILASGVGALLAISTFEVAARTRKKGAHFALLTRQNRILTDEDEPNQKSMQRCVGERRLC